MDGPGVHAELLELGDHLVGPTLGPAEDQRLVVGRDDGGGHLDLVHLVDVEEVLDHPVDSLGVALDLVEDRVGQVARDEAIDGAVERGGEQQGLVRALEATEHPLDLGHEAHVGHPVGLVEDEHVELVDAQLAAVAEVDEAARRGDDHLAAMAQLGDLSLDVGAAVHGDDPEADGRRQRGQHVVDLHRQLTGRQQHEATRCGGAALELLHLTTGAPEIVGDAHEHREAEAERLARTGLGLAADVAPGQGVGDGHGLDGERRLDAVLGERVAEVLADAERDEGRIGRIGVVLGRDVVGLKRGSAGGGGHGIFFLWLVGPATSSEEEMGPEAGPPRADRSIFSLPPGRPSGRPRALTHLKPPRTTIHCLT